MIDLFAGPGGLGEGFSALDNGAKFSIGLSAEMEVNAHRTLTLRSAFRHARRQDDAKALRAYYNFCNSGEAPHPSISMEAAWQLASDEAHLVTLGSPAGNRRIYESIEAQKLTGENVVVIGGPPCQAYSLVGRARNKGIKGYVAEDDHRHYLYKQYLRILDRAKPAAFVMENVKGILSSQVGGRRVFEDILTDLVNPSKAVGAGSGVRYTIHALTTHTHFEEGMDPSEIDAHDFVVKAEQFGLPQARHRVILLGVRADRAYDGRHLLNPQPPVSLRTALADLPPLRSRLSKDSDALTWRAKVFRLGVDLAREAERARDHRMAEELFRACSQIGHRLGYGSLREPRKPYPSRHDAYHDWVRDPGELSVWLNHEARSHMDGDLGRYFYAAAFAKVHKRSPKGHTEFALKGLAPAHKNWETGKFADRFRVQVGDAPSSTVTSHIAKDGHYFIHPDPAQCRSLTVREAARLQTFPDNYFFQGNRTWQYHQVGNAVPPLLAKQIARVVALCLS